MLLRQLVYLRALARQRHFGRAAATCGISQPTLSAAVKQLEAELAVPIVQRGRRFEGLELEVNHIIGLATADREPVLPVTRTMLEVASAVSRQLPANLAVA